MSIEWIVGIALPVVCALIGVIYLAGQSRDDKQDARIERNEHAFNEHVRECVVKHERIVRNETKVETLETEVGKLRDMRHEMMKHTTEALASWYVSVVEMIGKRVAELVALIERVKK
jgi:hypothetical protein